MVVAGLSPWHSDHARAAPAITQEARLPVHVLLEAYSVLTRLPGGLAMRPRRAAAALADTGARPVLTLDARASEALVSALADAQILGGAVYDGLVAATALAAGATLLSLDRRAARTYRAVGVELELL